MTRLNIPLLEVSGTMMLCATKKTNLVLPVVTFLFGLIVVAPFAEKLVFIIGDWVTK